MAKDGTFHYSSSIIQKPCVTVAKPKLIVPLFMVCVPFLNNFNNVSYSATAAQSYTPQTTVYVQFDKCRIVTGQSMKHMKLCCHVACKSTIGVSIYKQVSVRSFFNVPTADEIQLSKSIDPQLFMHSYKNIRWIFFKLVTGGLFPSSPQRIQILYFTNGMLNYFQISCPPSIKLVFL